MRTIAKVLFGLMSGILLLSLLAGCGGGGGDSVVLVKIEVTPAQPTIAAGTTVQFTATGIYSDTTRQDLTTAVTWSSSSTGTATVSTIAGSNGLASAVAPGSAIIKATMGAVSGSTTLTVTDAFLVSIGVTPPTPSIALGRSQQFTATGIFSDNTVQDLTTQVDWSSDGAVAAISNAGITKGLATSVGVGSTTITAALGNVVPPATTTLTVTAATLDLIDVTPALPTIAKGTPQQFTATGTYSDNTTEDLTAAVTWSSSNTGVATVSNATGSNGQVTTLVAGLATITATLDGVSGSTDLTVTPATLVSIDVSPTTQSIPLGLTQQFSASGNYTDGSVQDLTPLVTWSSSNTGIATVSNAGGSNGLATPVDTGSTTISATMPGGVTGSATLAVTAALLQSIAITPANPTIAQGTALPFTATGTYSDTTTQDLTAFVAWSSADGTVATISNAGATRGLATSFTAGSTAITAAWGDIVSPATTLTVTPATLTLITVTPATTTIFLGATEQFTAMGTFSDSSVQDLTAQVTWRSTPPTVAAISNVYGSNGLVTPIRVGQTTITATTTIFGVTRMGTTLLNVSSATLTGIVITPVNPSVAVGKTLQFKATGVYVGGLTQDLTNSVNLTWTSSNRAIATVINVPKKSKGLAKGVSTGSVTIKARDRRGGVSGTTTLTVTP